MGDSEYWQFDIGLEFVCWSFAERNNINEGFSEPKKDAEVIQVWGAAALWVFLTQITCYSSFNHEQWLFVHFPFIKVSILSS